MLHTGSILPLSKDTSPATAENILVGQKQLHNQADFGKEGTLIYQPKLTIGTIDDPLEAEADAMADTVMRMPEKNFIQRKCSHCEEEEKVQRKPLASFIQRKESSAGMVASETVSGKINSTKGSGSSMDSDTQSFMQSRFGTDFSDVKIHTGHESVQMNRELNAKAFTVGNDIYFNAGQYNPNSGEGKHLLAHELTHTVQQGGSTAIQRRSWVDDESACTSTQKILVQLIFDDVGTDVWTSARKTTFRNDFKSNIENTFNANSYHIIPSTGSYVPWYTSTSTNCPCYPAGFSPKVQIELVPDGETSVSEDWEVDVAANSSGTQIISDTNTMYGDLDEADNSAVTKLGAAPGVTQVPSVHEFGHFLGLDHPGEGLSEGLVVGGVTIIARELSSGADEYSHIGQDEDGHTVDGTVDLMGSGMGLRPFYFDTWRDHVLSKYGSGCSYSIL